MSAMERGKGKTSFGLELGADSPSPPDNSPSYIRRVKRWAEIKRYAELGFPQKEIAKKLGLNVRTARRYLHMPNGPPDRHSRSNMNNFIPELKTLLEGCPHASCPFYHARLKEKGYNGSLASVKRWVDKAMDNLVSQKRTN